MKKSRSQINKEYKLRIKQKKERIHKTNPYIAIADTLDDALLFSREASLHLRFRIQSIDPNKVINTKQIENTIRQI